MSSDAKIDDGTPLSKSSKDLVVPQGYLCDLLAVSLSSRSRRLPAVPALGRRRQLLVQPHDDRRQRTRAIDWASGTSAAYDGIIPASVDMYDVNSYFVNIVASCVRLPRHTSLADPDLREDHGRIPGP